jgi:hypothetical protein
MSNWHYREPRFVWTETDGLLTVDMWSAPGGIYAGSAVERHTQRVQLRTATLAGTNIRRWREGEWLKDESCQLVLTLEGGAQIAFDAVTAQPGGDVLERTEAVLRDVCDQLWRLAEHPVVR